MNKIYAGAAALLFVSACSPEPVALSSGIDRQYMDTSIRPGDNFFRYMNGKWLDETEIPADKSNYGGFIILGDEAQENIKAIIEEAATGDFAKGSDEQKVGDLYKSFLNMEVRNARGMEPLQPELARIKALASHDDVTRYFARASVYGVSVPMDLQQLVDWNDPTRYSMIITQGGLGLPDREYYLKDDEPSANLRAAYVEHVAKMFDLAGLADGAAAADIIMALETRLAEKQMSKEDARNRAENYQPVAREELSNSMPQFAWDDYLEEFGVPEIDSVVLYMKDYLRELDGIIRSTDIDTWRTYLSWRALGASATTLTAELDRQNFEFFGKTLSGTEEQQEMWRRGTALVSGNLGEVVGRVYVARHFPPEAKQRMETLVANLIRAYEKSIRELDWMSGATKEEALRKLSKFTPKIGYPDEWRDYSMLDIEAHDLFGNLQRAAEAEHQRQVNRHGGPVNRAEWGMTPQTVNAYYSPALNEIVFPAAILQPPFFDLEADEAVNYGAIGAVIGHEIGHGFDDQGSTFDGDGKLRNWWTDADRAEFKKRTDKLVAQYSEFAPFEDLRVNGEFTLGENIGDLGGIGIGLLAYKMSLAGREAPVIDGMTGVQRVFLGYAQVWRRKYRDEELRRRVATDPHAPSEYRANGSVRNVPEWYEAFDVREGDALYLPPEERVKIW
ncbi:MAG: peptidase M13 [Gammaproteobacteria bacterium]|nr:peptidase M13 [Gammaproteobacteria bacterium]MDH5305506.1 peptidase M13 [Gammaproteobacteria bacterium]MDH5323564.1 peptidase M13 [Gammaproteobacteria bacterium]